MQRVVVGADRAGTSEGHRLLPTSGSLQLEPRCVHTAFMILCCVEQKTALRNLRDEGGNYTTKYAAKVFIDSVVGLYPTTKLREGCGHVA